MSLERFDIAINSIFLNEISEKIEDSLKILKALMISLDWRNY